MNSMIRTDEFLIFILPLLLILGSAVIGTVYALPENTTDWNWGGIELWDDNLEEEEEIKDEKLHEEWAKDNE